MPAIESPAEKTMRRWYEVKLADRAAMLLHQASDRRLLERLALKNMNGTMGEKDDPVADHSMEDDMQVKIGDEVHNHYPANQPPQDQSPQKTAGNDWLKKAVLTASLLGAGGAVGAGIPWLAGAFDRSDAPAVTIPADADTLYELHIGAER